MADELLDILRCARRKLLAVRAVEGAVRLAAAGAILAAVGEAAWALAAWRGVLAGLGSHVSPLGAAAGVVLAAAAAGALAALAKAPGLREVAARLDARAGLRERLSTAAEIALEGGSAALAAAPVVRAQALAALREKRPQDSWPWTISARRVAGLGLSLAACLAIALLADSSAQRRSDAVGKLARAVPAMTPAQRAALAESFRRAATQPGLDEAAVRELLRAAVVVEARDAREMEKVLEELQKAGYAPLGAVPPELLAAVGIDGESPAPGGAGGRSTMAGRSPPPAASPPPAPEDVGAGYVSVYNPAYAARPLPAGGVAGPSPRAEPAERPFADAWSAARAQAADRVRRGAVPGPYRRLIQDFFAEQD